MVSKAENAIGLEAERRRAAWRRHGSGKRNRADCPLLGAANGPAVIPPGGRTGCGCRGGRFPAWPRAGACREGGIWRHPDQACDRGLPGEPLVRSLLRLRPLRRTLRGAGRVLPARRAGRGGDAVPLHQPRDAGHRTLLVRDARRVRRRGDGRVLHHQRHQLHGLLRPAGPAVLLQPVQQLHVVRELLLPRDGADVPEPVLPGGGHVRGNHEQQPVGIRDIRLPDHPGSARRRGRDLEGLQHLLGPGAAWRQRQRLRVLEALGQ